MNSFRLAIHIAAVCLAVCGPGQGQDLGHDLHPGIIGGKDVRVPLEERGAPWDAVGQVNVAAFSRGELCTGTLIAPAVVLTAAHCVMNPLTGKPYLPGDIHFLAGVRGEDNKGVATAQCVHVLPSYRSYEDPRRNPLQNRASDAAVLVLSTRLDVEPAPVDAAVEARPGLPLTHVAYPADHRFMPYVHWNCRLLNSDLIEGLWFNNCDTHPGSSGGPVFTRTGETYRVAAIMAAAGQQRVNVAVPVSRWLDLTRDAACP